MRQRTPRDRTILRLAQHRRRLEEESDQRGLVERHLLGVRARPVGGGAIAEEGAVLGIHQVLRDGVQRLAGDGLERRVGPAPRLAQEERHRVGLGMLGCPAEAAVLAIGAADQAGDDLVHEGAR